VSYDWIKKLFVQCIVEDLFLISYLFVYLFRACVCGHASVVRLLYERGALPDRACTRAHGNDDGAPTGRTPLMLAVLHRKDHIVCPASID
jgi:hypothetical protein